MRISLPGYQNLIARCREDGPRGGVGLFIKETSNCKIREDLSVFIPHVFESLLVELENTIGRNAILGVIYRPNSEPRADLYIYTTTMFDLMDIISKEKKSVIM